MADAVVAFDGWNAAIGWGEQGWGEGYSNISAAGEVGNLSYELGVYTSGSEAEGIVERPEYGVSYYMTGEGIVTGVGDTRIVYLWSYIDDSQTANWSDIDDSQSITWTNVNTTQSASWTEINDAQ